MERLSRRSNHLDRSLNNSWKWCGKHCPSQEIVFFAQISLIFIVVIASVINLALDTGRAEYWAGTMSACLGYILPAPAMMLKRSSAHGGEGMDYLDGHFFTRSQKNKKEEEEEEEEEKKEKIQILEEREEKENIEEIEVEIERESDPFDHNYARNIRM